MLKRILYILLTVIGFVGVRAMAPNFLNDPFIDFFRVSDYYNYPLPDILFWKYGFSLLLRYLVNGLLSLILVHLIFKKLELLKLTSIILLIIFIVGAPILLFLVYNADIDQYRYLFYIRRILIHPVPVLILVPALLYYERVSKKGNK